MKLYTFLGPNPDVVRMFLAEKGVEIEKVEVNSRAPGLGENREPAHLARNPAGQVPTLELDDGTYLAEITAICEYIDELHPEPVLVGRTPEERAKTRMWTRRVDLNICEPLTNAFRFSTAIERFRPRIRVMPEAADSLKALAREKCAWLNGLMGGTAFICGDEIRQADIHLFCFLKFGIKTAEQPFDRNLKNLAAWYDRMADRPSAEG